MIPSHWLPGRRNADDLPSTEDASTYEIRRLRTHQEIWIDLTAAEIGVSVEEISEEWSFS